MKWLAHCLTVLAFLVGIASATQVKANPILVVDQQQTASDSELGIQAAAPLGQEFTPSLSALDVVELVTRDGDQMIGGGANLYVNIRGDTITGSILGTSSTVTLPNGFYGVTQFDFASLVSLTPANRYVIEVVASGDDWRVENKEMDPYPGGRVIYQGAPQSAWDLRFREGLSVPEPSTVVLLSMGTLALLAYARRRRWGR